MAHAGIIDQSGGFGFDQETFREYERSIGNDFCSQNFESELASLPRDYAPPAGCLLLARVADRPVGCVALRRIDADTCEMKRLYLRPECRGLGYGRLIAEKVNDEARSGGYSKIRLDTLPTMTEAIALYQSLEFVRIEPYRYNLIAGAVFMEKNANTGSLLSRCRRIDIDGPDKQATAGTQAA